MPIPVFAGIFDAIPVIFLIIAFIGWILNLVSGKNRPRRPAGAGRADDPPVRPLMPRDNRLQNEIDVFLREAQSKGRNPDDEPVEVVEIEEVEELGESPRRLTPRPQRQAELQRAEAQARAQSARGSHQPGANIANRKDPGSDNLGSGIRQRVLQPMQEGRVVSNAQHHIGHSVDQSVSEHLGQFSADQRIINGAAKSKGDLPAVADSISNLFRDASGIRQAIILNEILTRPSSRRRW